MGTTWKVVNLLALALVATSTVAIARDAPRNVALSTGSNIATWTLPPTPSQGLKQRQTPVVYLHGGPGMYTEERRLVMGQAFRDAGFATVYYDQIGGGQSARIPATQYSLARMIADLEALRVSLGTEKMVLWGNSWGAQLAVLYAQANPGRVAGFVLTSPGGFPGENFRRDYAATKRTNVNIGRELTAAINQIDRKGGQAEANVSQVDSGRLFDAVTSADLLEGMVCKASNVGQADLPGGGNLFVNRIVPKEVASARPNWTTIVRAPSLIVRGACDFIPLQSADRYVAVTGGQRTDVANVGHGLLEDPAAISAILGEFARTKLNEVP
jgi:pimeloyl-ACP methyl ester carboxylesterase